MIANISNGTTTPHVYNFYLLDTIKFWLDVAFHSNLEVYKMEIIKISSGHIQQNVHNMEYNDHWGL